MRHYTRYRTSIFAAAAVLVASCATAQRPAQLFCPRDANAVPDAATPNLATGEGAAAIKSYPLAYSHLHPLAEAGNVEAMRALGGLLLQSCGINGDHTLAMAWFDKAAETGDARASSALGLMYLSGFGVKQNDSLAFKWLTQAAKGGEMLGEENLGILYLDGRGIMKDPHQGIVWSVKAAEQGAPGALANIGLAYSSGSALPKNNRRALFWLLAAMQRSTAAVQRTQIAARIAVVARQLSGDDERNIAQAEQKWTPGTGSLDDVLADADRRRDQGDAPPDQAQPAREPVASPGDKYKKSAGRVPARPDREG